MSSANPPLSLTFADVLVVPAYSEVLPAAVDPGTRLGGLALPLPLLSAAMDTVTEARLAGAMAQAGGLGVLHKNLSPSAQAEAVREVKRMPVLPAAEALPAPACDARGRLLAAAAVGVGADLERRAPGLIEAEVDLLVVDTAHGHSRGVLQAVERLRVTAPAGLVVVAGNVATAEGARALAEAGAHVVKVGVGPGSICTTRVVAGVGVAQWSAVCACAAPAHAAGATCIADGGIRTSGDIVKALAAGADAVMLGSLLAGTAEAPGAVVADGARLFKDYRGMGSAEAMRAGSADRYGHDPSRPQKWVAEGVAARVPYCGPLAAVLAELVGGLRAGMGYVGAGTLAELHARARFVRVTPAGQRESGVHDVEPLP